MNICVTVNSKYEFVMLQSLYENHGNGEICLYVIQRDFTDFDKKDIAELSAQFENKVIFITADPRRFDNFPISNTGRDNLSLV